MKSLLVLALLFIVGCGAGRAVDGITITHADRSTTWCGDGTCYHPDGTTTYIPSSPLSHVFNYGNAARFNLDERWDSNRSAYYEPVWDDLVP